jgi:hypothetical protein
MAGFGFPSLSLGEIRKETLMTQKIKKVAVIGTGTL